MHWVKAFTSLHFLSWGAKWPSTQFFLDPATKDSKTKAQNQSDLHDVIIDNHRASVAPCILANGNMQTFKYTYLSTFAQKFKRYDPMQCDDLN